MNSNAPSLLAVLLIAGLGPMSSAKGDAFANGSFEIGSPLGGSDPNASAGTHGSATGWALDGNVSVVSKADMPLPTENGQNSGYFGGTSDGAVALEFNASQSSTGGSASQTFDTTLGYLYTVTFDFGKTGSNQDSGDPAVASLRLQVFDVVSTLQIGSNFTVTDSVNSTPINNIGANILNPVGVVDDPPYKPATINMSYQFVATGASSTILFTDVSAGNMNFADVMLDNVRLTSVPEPASTALLLLAGFGLFSRRNRGS